MPSENAMLRSVPFFSLPVSFYACDASPSLSIMSRVNSRLGLIGGRSTKDHQQPASPGVW